MPATERPKVMICVPVYEAVKPAVYHAHAALWVELGRRDLRCSLKTVGPRVAIREARNRTVVDFLQSDCTHLLFLDDDILPPAGLIFKLLDVQVPIVGALVHDSVGAPIVFDRIEVNGQIGETRWYAHPKTGAFPCWAVGSGAMLIQRAVLESLPAPQFYYDKTSRSMDVNFCRDAQAAGFGVWCSATAASGQLTHENPVV